MHRYQSRRRKRKSNRVVGVEITEVQIRLLLLKQKDVYPIGYIKMSRFGKQLGKQLVTLARQGRGNFKTVADRSRIADRYSERLAKLNIQIRDVKHIKTTHIEK